MELNDFEFLLPHYINLIESSKGMRFQAEDSWKVDGDRLAVKYGANLLSIADLLEGTKPIVPNLKLNIHFFDYYSIFAIARSALETYLTLHYIFVEHETCDEEKKYRHNLWTLSSLCNRQRFSVFSQIMQKTLNDNKADIQRLIKEVKNSLYFNGDSTSSKARSSINHGKNRIDWKPEGGWNALATRASLNSRFFDDAYNLLSAVCHSDQVIVNYIDNSKDGDIHVGLTITAVNILNVITACFLKDYADTYQPSGKYLSDHHDLADKIEVLKHVHSDAYEKMQLDETL